jgi:signal transduction histidine kinase
VSAAGRELHRGARVGSTLARESLAGRPSVSRRVAQTGESVFLPVVPPDILAGQQDDVRRHFARFPLGSLVSVPLATARGVFGVMNAMRSPQAPALTEDDHAMLQELANRAALAIEAAQRYAQAQDAIQLRDEFLSIASHELKTPLTTLQIRLQGMGRLLARQERVDAAQLTAKLAQTDGDMARLARLIEDLLDVSRISAGKLDLELADVDLAELARDTIERHVVQAQRVGAPIELSAPERVRGRFDRVRLEQLLSNLLTNALKYAPGRPIEVSVRATDGAAIMSVRDHGMGIPAEHLERIFGRFERAVSSMNYGGLGLGLYIARQIVEAHGGRIEVESLPGAGATFTTTLPLAQPGA